MIFKNKLPNLDKLISYGFELSDGKYVYVTDIVDGQLRLTVTVENGEISTEVYDVAAEDVYTLHLVEGAVGGFVGRVRAEHEQVLRDIETQCYDYDVFKEDYAKKIILYAKEKYGDEAEYLWQDLPDAAVIRRKDSRKWYVLLMAVLPKRLGLDGKEPIEIVDLRFDADELPNRIDNVSYFAGYHMNKKHWITILLDGSVSLDEILAYVDKSYALAAK
ncbi:MAG: MmcQ/YjbR family DNA-binding protein [Clostridiales bacterium]|nr:MmcQ/YjbR family DNA-binding protein [Clostridiales bacterium]